MVQERRYGALSFLAAGEDIAAQEPASAVPTEGQACYSRLGAFLTQQACTGFGFLRIVVFSYPPVSLPEQLKYLRVVGLRFGKSLKLVDRIVEAAAGNLHFRQTELCFHTSGL